MFQGCGLDSTTARRIRKRTNGYIAVRRSLDYIVVYSLWQEAQIGSMPPEPDPADLTVSKRSWEWSVQIWRSELKRIVRNARTCSPIVHFTC